VRRLTALAALALAACTPPEPRVDPAQHDAFWLWAGVKPPAALAQARTVYLLAGEVRRDGAYVPLRDTPQVRRAEVWLVVRAARIDWSAPVEARIMAELGRWAARSRVAGLQVDFDSSTRGLDRYGAFLKGLRARLPRRYRLSVTGLMDWSAQGDPAALDGLVGTLDEIVVQTYRGRTTIPEYGAYLKSLSRLRVPYRVGVVEGGVWREPAGLRDDPQYRGTVVFLLNPAER
jgi:hypothetical protein